MAHHFENKLFCTFIGTWQLVACTETDAKGTITYPWGMEAIGYLIYTKEGMMAVQIMRKNRMPFSTDNLMLITAKEAQALAKDYNAYSGTFEIDEAQGVVIHNVQTHLNPNIVGKKNIRKYAFYDDKLELTTQGSSNVKKLIWQRLTYS